MKAASGNGAAFFRAREGSTNARVAGFFI